HAMFRLRECLEFAGNCLPDRKKGIAARSVLLRTPSPCPLPPTGGEVLRIGPQKAARTRNDATRTRNDATRTRNDATRTRNDATRTRNDATHTRCDAG